ncbi:metal tolerance protein 7 isoform X1 [Carex littledalei]|uniref:Metal tolerance protein 7 isoform X1 n=1 Tax=Carex littledalei TaxID=544730 RepID=A0A833QT41_9POAL|nr:metal tolerance protein 7 isoform X1 [Carex littledalei]
MEKVPLSPMKKGSEEHVDMEPASAWRLRFSDFRMPERPQEQPLVTRVFKRGHGKQQKIAKYYKKQESLLKGFTEMENIQELGYLDGTPTDAELEELAKSERMAINISNFVNLILFISKVLASIESRSMAVIASTLDSLLDLLSGLILWFTSYAMKKPNKYHYPIGKKRMQPVGIIVFASVMGTLGFQILIESGRQLVTNEHTTFDKKREMWMVGSMASVTVVKFVLMIYCRSFKNEIVRAYAQDHFFDVITNSIGLVSSLLAAHYYWWMDPVGAILIALYTIITWARTVLENVRTLIGKTAPAEYLTKLTYLVWNHNEEIRHIDTVRAYTFGTHYFVEVDIVLPSEMPLNQAHDIGESLQEKLEQLPEVERAFVHLDFEYTHRPEHKSKV